MVKEISLSLNCRESRGEINRVVRRVMGWVISFGRNRFSSYNIPDSTYEKLAEYNPSNLEIDHVSFSSEDGWVIVYEEGPD